MERQAVSETDAVVYVFRRMFGQEPRLFRAPGRVNLIGEHTDYNEGFVLPMAIQRGTTVGAAPRKDRIVRVHSVNLRETAQFDLDRPGPTRRGIWLDYVEGIAQALIGNGVKVDGAELVLSSDVSIGGGLSSSAALEISVGTALVALSGSNIDKVALALAGQKAEHTYVGAKTGIMDQFIAALGKADHALLIDCRELKGTLVPLNLSGSAIVVCDSRVRHSLASSEYNQRRTECEKGVELLSRVIPGIRALRDVNSGDFRRHEQILPETIRRRCRHVITENERTLAATRALSSGDAPELGRLFTASHRSLRDDYQVSCRELDLLVESAGSVAGVLGARMTGGGFGGCTVNLVRREALEAFQDRVSNAYLRDTGLEPLIFHAEGSDGAREIANR
jgi:galactokinase